jgi:hypothetical protein
MTSPKSQTVSLEQVRAFVKGKFKQADAAERIYNLIIILNNEEKKP